MKTSLFTILALAVTSLLSTLAVAQRPDHDRVEKLASATTVEVGCVTVHGEDLLVSVCGDTIAWCVDGWCGTDPAPTTWGCQYFPEEGPADDIAVCILTSIALKCCACLSVCPDEDDGEE